MQLIALVAGALYVAILLFKSGCALIACRSSACAGVDATHDIRNVTIMQPILSGDPRLATMLDENVLRLPHARFLWLIDHGDPEAASITSALVARHACRSIDVLRFDEAPAGINPKTFKLHGALPSVDTDVCVVLDDNSVLGQDALARLVAALSRAALSTALPCYRADGNGPSRMLAQFVNNNAALTYLPLLPFGEPVSINGMCYAFQTATFTAHDAFGPILGALADDLALAGRLQSLGLRLVQTMASVEVQTSVPTWRRYRRQMHRWFLFATLLLQQQPWSSRLVIGLLHGVPPIVLAVLIVTATSAASIPAIASVVIVLTIRALILRGLQRRVTGAVRDAWVLSIASELLQPLHLVHSVFDRTIDWRGRVYRVHANDAFESV